MTIFTANYYEIILFNQTTAHHYVYPRAHHPWEILVGAGELTEALSLIHRVSPPQGLTLQICRCIVFQHQLESCIFRSIIFKVWNRNTEQWSILVILLGNCLLDLPRKQILGPEELPGQTYDASQQCNLTFGPEYSVCPGMDVCARLWCAVVRQGQMVCLTKKLPAVEGTPCGKGRICLQGKCVDKTKKKYYSVSDFLVTQGLET